MYYCRGSKIFSAFIGFLKSKDPADGTEQALLSELSAFNDYLKENVRHVQSNLLYVIILLIEVLVTGMCLCNFNYLIDSTDKFKVYMPLLEFSLPTLVLDLLVVA